MDAPTTQPDWDLTPYFSALGADDYVAFRDALTSDVNALRERADGLAALTSDSAADWADLLSDVEGVSARFGHLSSYLSCVGAANSADEQAQRQEAALATLGAGLQKLLVAIQATVKQADDAAFSALTSDERLETAAYYLSRVRRRAATTMSAELENLNADLSVDGMDAWGRLYDRVSGNLSFDLVVPGQETRTLPVAMTRSLLEDADAQVRAGALRGAGVAWERVSDTVAACLNAISGTRLTLYERRGVDHFLDPALFDAGIERATLDMMLGVVRSRQDVARRYLKHKATLLGKQPLGFQDLMAPLPSAGDDRIPWDDATTKVRDAFAATYPALGSYADHALDQRWIDHTPRANKRPGGFCTSSHVIGQSRVFMTYNGAMGDVQTLAHELGHGFHGWLMKDMRSWARRYPMTLAETASTFAEQVVTDAALADERTTRDMRASILDTRLQDAEAFLLNIPMRFDFEHAVYSQRAEGELSVSQFKQLMVDAQRTNYGDALAEDQLDPWFWASKLHFYITDISFYNFPYTFGYLFSLGIFARAKAEGPEFFERYEQLLRETGSKPAEQVAADALGVDLQKPEFWNASIDLIEADLDELLKVTS